MEIVPLAISLVALIFSVSAHEAVHALAAAWQGDRTALEQGRATLNPWRHLDVFWTLLMPIVLFVISSGMLIFGMARPAPRRDDGPRGPAFAAVGFALAANLAIAVVALSTLRMLHGLSPRFVEPHSMNAYFLGQLALVNLLLVIVNAFLPIAPLDAARLVRLYLPERGRAAMDTAEPFGFLAVMLLLALLYVGRFLDPVFEGVEGGLSAIFDAEYARELTANLRRAPVQPPPPP
jgi:Zn-dependent protease